MPEEMDVTTDNWQKQTYERAFHETCVQIEMRRGSDPSFTREALRGMLESAYVDEGNDWQGRGALGDTILSATIAAYEHVLAEWEDGD